MNSAVADAKSGLRELLVAVLRRIKDGMRPWPTLAHKFELPKRAIAEKRILTNAKCFGVNYALVVAGLFAIQILLCPMVLVAAVPAFSIYFYLFFMRKSPILVAGRPVGPKEKLAVVMAVAALLSVLSGTLLCLAFFTVIAASIVGAHAVTHVPAITLVAETEDQHDDPEGAPTPTEEERQARQAAYARRRGQLMGSAPSADGTDAEVDGTGAMPVPMMNPAAVAAAEGPSFPGGGFVNIPTGASPLASGPMAGARAHSPKKYE